MTTGFVTIERRLEEPPRAISRLETVGRWRYWAIVFAVFAVFVTGLGLLVGNATMANADFEAAHSALNLTRQHTKDVLAQLALARRDLHIVAGEVAQATTARARDTAQLREIETALSNAQVTITTKGSAIDDLHSCLAGVEQSLNALAVGDQNSALGALNAASASCNSAVTTDG
jgi:hypothetical protein